MVRESDDDLVRYVLGELPDSEAERLDERSIADEAFAIRLREVENDLVDGYARGELSAHQFERVDRACHVSSHLQQKMRFAKALQEVAMKSGGVPQSMPRDRVPGRLWLRSLAAAAVVLVFVSGYAAIRNVRLREEMSQLAAQRAAVEQQNARLQEELERRPVASPQGLTAMFLLRPPRRGLSSETPVLSIARGTTDVRLRLVVETGEYVTFWAALKDASTARVLSRTPDLPAENDGNDRVVTFTVPVASFEARRYLVELSALMPDGQTELLAQYPIQVVLE